MGQPGEGSFIEGDGVVLEAGHPPVIEPLVPQSSSIAPFLDLSPPSNVPLGASERLSTGFLCPYLWPYLLLRTPRGVLRASEGF